MKYLQKSILAKITINKKGFNGIYTEQTSNFINKA